MGWLGSGGQFFYSTWCWLGAVVIWVCRWAGMLKMTHIMGSWCWMWCGCSARMSTEASQFSSLSPVSKWIGFLKAWRLCSEDGALQMCQSKVASILKARAHKFQVATLTAFYQSRAIVLVCFGHMGQYNQHVPPHHYIHGNFSVHCSSLIGYSLCVS